MSKNINFKNKYVIRVIGLLMIISALTMRPALLGELYTPLSLVLLAIALTFCVSLNCLYLTKYHLKRNIVIAFLIAMFWIYLLAQSIFLGVTGESLLNTAKATISISVIAVVFCILLSDSTINRSFFRWMIFLCLMEILSYAVTIMLSYGLGIDINNLKIYKIETAYEERGGGVFLPLTIFYGSMVLGDTTIYRLGGPFREAGIFQAFIIWAYFSLRQFELNHAWIKLSLLGGLIFTMSTTGIGVFFSCYVLQYLLRRSISVVHFMYKFSIVIFLIGLAVVSVLYMPVFGFLIKSETREESIVDRWQAMVTGLQTFLENPIGLGIYTNPFDYAGINFIAATSLIGIIGVALVAAITIYAVLSIRDIKERHAFLVSISPFVLTGLVSQPFLDAPLIFVMLFQSGMVLSQEKIARSKNLETLPGLATPVEIINQRSHRTQSSSQLG